MASSLRMNNEACNKHFVIIDQFSQIPKIRTPIYTFFMSKNNIEARLRADNTWKKSYE